MSDVEEPPSKMTRYTDLQYLDECEDALDEGHEDGLDEGQEEWLSDGVLTDDEYNPSSENIQIELKIDTTSQEGNNAQEDDNEAQVPSEASPTGNGQTVDIKTESKNTEQNIEATLNNLDAVKSDNEVAEDLNAFLIRKCDSQVQNAKLKKADPMTIEKQEVTRDDGNDTDDLLRMLGEDNVRLKKKTLKMVKCEKNEEGSSDDDDAYIYERSKMKSVRLAKTALMKKQPVTKAEPEDVSDDADASSDGASAVKRMFVARAAAAARLDSKPQRTETPVKPIKQYINKNTQPKSILKSSTPVSKMKAESKPKSAFKSVEIKTPSPFKPLEKQTSKSEEKEATFKSEQLDDIIDEEFLDDDGLDVDEDFGSESEEEGVRQRIRRPERMDEEVPSDGDSHTEDGSLYDELPSSDSDDMDDWFSLDIRAERAGDYLPLLGVRARALLAAERARARGRVAALRRSLAALGASARRQADSLRAAAMALAEIDDTLRAA